MLTLSQDPTIKSHPRFLFVDMNAFFASVEQQENSALRGHPTIVVPVVAQTTCAIAASYEAKAYGIKTGTRVSDALRVCPKLKIVKASPKLYVKYHQGILDVLSQHFANPQVMSIDEMACGLSDWQQRPEMAREMAAIVKRDIIKNLGDQIKCSIGIAPNKFLAKVASDIIKPDGLTILMGDYTPQLFKLLPRDLPGIGHNMEARLMAHGIRTVKELWDRSPEELYKIWGSELGVAWYYMMRGSLQSDYGRYFESKRKSVSHSHVFAPEFRTAQGAKQIVARLLSKTLERLRRYNLYAQGISLSVSYRRFGEYRDKKKIEWQKHFNQAVNDDFFWTEVVTEFCKSLPNLEEFQPSAACIVFFDLSDNKNHQLNLFDQRDRYSKLSETMDLINERFGHVLDLAPAYFAKREAPMRIGFRNTEGK